MRKPSPTVKEVFDKYFKLHVKHHVSRPQEVLRGFEMHWKPLANMKASTLLTIELQEWLNELATRVSGQTANRQFNNLRACLNWGVEMELFSFAKDNPCSKVKKVPVQERESYVSLGDEFERLRAVLAKYDNDITDAIWLLLCTASRKSNALEMKWKDIDFVGRVWVVQSYEAKAKKTLRIPITKFAMGILSRRAMKYRTQTEWVFPQPGNLKAHRVNIDYFWRTRIRPEANLPGLHIHDLRHTAATWMGQNGASAFAIQRTLGHSSSKMTERYTHLNTTAVLHEMESAQAVAFGNG